MKKLKVEFTVYLEGDASKVASYHDIIAWLRFNLGVGGMKADNPLMEEEFEPDSVDYTED
jgi:hypothetical protein